MPRKVRWVQTSASVPEQCEAFSSLPVRQAVCYLQRASWRWCYERYVIDLACTQVKRAVRVQQTPHLERTPSALSHQTGK